MTTSIDGITAAIDARIAEIKPELDRLVRARLELTPAAPDSGSEHDPPPAPRRKRRQPALTLSDALPGVRDGIADGPKSVHALTKALGYHPTSSASKNVVRQALEQLGATQDAKARWSLPDADPPPAAPAAEQTSNGHARQAVASEASQEDLEQAYLERQLLLTLDKAVEPMTAGGIAKAIDASATEVLEVCKRLTDAGELDAYSDGRYAMAGGE